MASKASDTDRLHEALIELCFERGLRATTIEELLGRAGVGDDAFQGLFIDLEDLFHFVFTAEIRRYLREAAPVFDPLAPWRERVRATVYALYRFIAADPRLAHLLVVECRMASERTRLLAGSRMEALVDLIDEGRAELADPGQLSRATAEAIGGGIFNQIYATVGKGGMLPDERRVVPQLLYCVVLPYLGSARAAEELRAPPPPPLRAGRSARDTARLAPQWPHERVGEAAPKVTSAPYRAGATVSRAARSSNLSASDCSPPLPTWSPSAATGRRRSPR
jgi:AcrR family transcriptional regulator